MSAVSKFGFMSNEVNIRGSDGVSPSYVNNNFLRRDGNTPCTGSLDMTGNTLTNVSDPVNEQDVATKHYVNNDFLRRDGTNTCTGSIDMTGNTLINVSDPTNGQDVATNNYTNMNFLRTDGANTCTHSINLGGNNITNLKDPVNPQDATTKNYTNMNFLRTDGANTCTHSINLGGNNITNAHDPVNPQDLATKHYVDSITFDKVYLKAMVSINDNESQTLNVGEHSHVNWNIFKSIHGDSSYFDSSTGIFTAPFAGIYHVSLLARLKGDELTSALTNTYFSVNNDTNYADHVNTVYSMYSSFNSMEWHTFHFSGFLRLNVRDTVRLKTGYGRGVFTFHSSAAMTITRFS